MSQRWRAIKITDFERRQIAALRQELDQVTTILTANVVGYPQIRPHALARLRRFA